MKTLVAALVALSLAVFWIGTASARGGRGSGHFGSARGSHFSATSRHHSGFHVGPHARFGSASVSHRFAHPHRFHHRPWFHRHPFGHGRPTIFFHYPFGSVLFRHDTFGIGSYPAIISTYPTVQAFTTPTGDNRSDDKYSTADRPLITFMLNRRDALGLSPEQVQSLETLRADFERQAIRQEADIRIGEIDLGTLLKGNVVDMAQVEAKLGEVERSRVELRLARIRTIEEGKAVLSPEQREKLEALLTQP
jgi:hypothetical protein